TRKLSSSAPMVVGGSPPARVGRRWATKKSERPNGFSLFCIQKMLKARKRKSCWKDNQKLLRKLRRGGRSKKFEEASDVRPEWIFVRSMRIWHRAADEEVRRLSRPV
ncbi:hypothetical protein, partial [Anaerobacillus sp. 1_MG-2023]|uniref:hypothetical protein n=1 Tax=Anaerobacillus sp. 1_MG-2023 TaxID=3062655 RepID=UPI0026E3921D